jgi:enediyne polyketide synthase
VYDTLLFHGPRFRRLRAYRRLTAWTCLAEVECATGEPWFGDYLPQQLLLGDIGARDAVVHVLQACIPHTRVLPVAVERITIAGSAVGVVFVDAKERHSDGESFVWDVDVRDDEGRLVERWEGLTLRNVGPSHAPPQWAPPLLVPYLERRLAELAGRRIGIAFAGRSRGQGATDVVIGEAAGHPVAIRRTADGRPEADNGGVSAAHLDGYTLAVAGDGRVTCDVEEARPEHRWRDLLGPQRLILASRIAVELGEQLTTSAARVWAAAECVRKSGRPAPAPLALTEASGDGWALLRTGRAAIATYAGQVTAVESAVAFAFLIEEDA